MLKKIIYFFVPEDIQETPEAYRRHKLVVIILLLTSLFDLNYAGLTILIDMPEGTMIMLVTFLFHVALLLLTKSILSLIWLTNLYVLFGVMAVNGCIYFSGGFFSPVLPWLATSPIVAMLMAGRTTGITWAVVNTMTVCIYGALSKNGFVFPNHYDSTWENFFRTNCFSGLVTIIFLVSLVYENGKNAALQKLAAQSTLLAEEKKKTALTEVAQEIHDNVGQTLAIIKMNLHLLERGTTAAASPPLQESLQMLGTAIQDLRGLSHALYQENVEGNDLLKVLRTEIEKLSKTGLYQVHLTTHGILRILSNQAVFMLSRIAKEAICNVVKHANARSVAVELRYEGKYCTLLINDDGIGMKKEEMKSAGLGFQTMYSRIKLIGGELAIDSKPGVGTTITVRVPAP